METRKITEEKLTRWYVLNKERLDLEREARQLDKERELLSTEFKAALEADGKASVSRGRFRVSLVDGRPSVAWKDELVRIAGADKAAELVAAAPVPKRVQVEETKAAA